MVTAAAAVADLGKMPTLVKGPKEVLSELGFQVGCHVSCRRETRGVYRILEIRKAAGKQATATVVLVLMAKLISMEELWEMIEVRTGRSPIKNAAAVEAAPAVPPAEAAPTVSPVEAAPGDGTAVRQKTISEICEEAAANISARLPAAGSASSTTQSSLEVTADKAVAGATAEVTDDAIVAAVVTDVQATGAPEASILPGIAKDVADKVLGASVTAGVPVALKLAVKPDYSFKESLEIPIGVFQDFWYLVGAPKLKYSIDPNWPENNLIRNQRNAGNALAAAVTMAIWKLGMRCVEGIKAEKFIQRIVEPTNKLFAYPGPAGESANRD
jgi:hypothetical protein